MGWEPPALVRGPVGLVHGGVFAHVEGAGLDPEGVVDDTVHDGVGVYGGAEALVPVLLRVLGAEHRRGVSVAALEEFEQDDCRWTPCFDCGVCPQMDTDIQIGPTGKTLLPLTVVRS